MSTADATTEMPGTPGSATSIDRLETWAEATSDWINPILVKEVRQALKSWTFMATFLFLLLASWCVSVFGVLAAGSSIQYGRAGMGFYYGYIALLSFASYIVVPFLAYRNLLSERDQSTFEVLSITTLRPKQIVWGKLFTAVVQLFVFFSALTPFIAFTYLLGGIDIVSIMVSLVWTTLASIGLSMITLTNSTLFQGKGWQSFQTLFVLGALLWACGAGISVGVYGASAGGSMFNEWEFWVGTAVCLTFYIGYFVLLQKVATAQLTFEADNRSTGIRVALVALELLGLLWLAGTFLAHIYFVSFMPSAGDLATLSLILGWVVAIHAAAFGLFFATESDTLSRRVARGIPRNPLVRLVAAPFYPGGGRGLLLAIAMLIVPGVVTVLLALFAGRSMENELAAFAAGCLYVVLYLGIACWIGRRGLASVKGFQPAHARVTTVILAALGVVLPVAYEATISTMFGGMIEGNIVVNITNPMVVIYKLADGHHMSPLVLALLGLLTGLVLMLNLRAIFAGVAEILRGPAGADAYGADANGPVAGGFEASLLNDPRVDKV